MPRALRLVRDERGFTLIEVLIVILLIAVLAAVALPMFLGHAAKAQDASAKSDARNLVSYIDSCYVVNDDYRKCSAKADVEADDVDWGTGPGQVSVVASTKTTYEIAAVSEADSSGSNHVFTIKRTGSGGLERSCTGTGGCNNGSW